MLKTAPEGHLKLTNILAASKKGNQVARGQVLTLLYNLFISFEFYTITCMKSES